MVFVFAVLCILNLSIRSAEKLRSLGVSVIVRPDAPWEKAAADYGSVEFQHTMSFRTEFLMR